MRALAHKHVDGAAEEQQKDGHDSQPSSPQLRRQGRQQSDQNCSAELTQHVQRVQRKRRALSLSFYLFLYLSHLVVALYLSVYLLTALYYNTPHQLLYTTLRFATLHICTVSARVTI